MALRSTTSETSRRRYSPEEAFARICPYCAYQERSHKEVRTKLFSYGLFASQVDELLSRLITEGFLNEERFARAFAGGKFRMQKWGRLKIVRALETHGLNGRCIQRGLKEIDGTAYTKALRQLLTRKMAALKEPNLFKARQKAAHFAMGKGYEPELVWELLRELTEE